jgi:site-specific DNA-methyltransferase (adenine-specific)
MITALRGFVGTNQMMAYLVMMAARLVELHRVLKPTGSLYLHCDPTASHYLKIVLDTIFGAKRFRNEIIWKRTSSHGNVSTTYGDVTDTILYYARGDKPTWNHIYIPYTDKHIESSFTHVDPDGRRFTTSDLRNPGYHPNLIYEYKGYKPHPNGWAISREKWKSMIDKENFGFHPTKTDVFDSSVT